MRWYVPDVVNQEESEQNEIDWTKKGADSTDTYLEEQVVICNDEDTDGRARVTMDEERVLHVDWTEMWLCR